MSWISNRADLVRAGLALLALGTFFVLGYNISKTGGIAFGWYTVIVVAAVAAVVGLHMWDKRTEGRQAWIVILVAGVLVFLATRSYEAMDAANKAEFMANLRAAGLILLGFVVSFALTYKPKKTSSIVTDMSSDYDEPVLTPTTFKPATL